jgi:hypothetical protein
MKFEEIFNKPGLYVTDSFSEGVCFEVTKEGYLYLVIYKHKDDILPQKTNALVYKGLFAKEYKKVFTRQSLFK